MGILTRIVRIWKADINGVMDELEDKELLLKQHLREMEEELHRKDARHTGLVTEHRRFRLELEKTKRDQASLEDDLKIAIKKDKDDISRMLIKKIRLTDKTVEESTHLLEKLQQEIETLRAVLEKQKIQFQELNQKTVSFLLNKEQDRRNGTISDLTSHNQNTSGELTDEEIDLDLIKYKQQYKASTQGEV
ncbi:MAG: PspA/IM30 family protein [Desulfobulbaceae bacterium]|nr:PspA/IM30 family protein [Desulfobulbaceae bacterium]